MKALILFLEMPSYNVVDPVVGNQTLQYTVRALRPGPVTDIFLQLLTDQVSDPETIFQAAIDITYKEACQRNNINAKKMMIMFVFQWKQMC